MPSRDTVEAFAAEVEGGRFIEAIEGWYTPAASMAENMSAPRVGRDVLVEGERRVMARSKSITARRSGPILIDGDHVVIRWVFEFTGEDGAKSALDEVAWQRWEGEKIAEERFFYDPAQMA